VPVTERAELPSGEFFQSDLVGLQVIDVPSGQPLGVVEDLQHYGGPPLLVLTYQGREVLIPFVPEICNVDLSAKVIRATLPDGLIGVVGKAYALSRLVTIFPEFFSGPFAHGVVARAKRAVYWIFAFTICETGLTTVIAR
jgi:hypothetical protein